MKRREIHSKSGETVDWEMDRVFDATARRVITSTSKWYTVIDDRGNSAWLIASRLARSEWREYETKNDR